MTRSIIIQDGSKNVSLNRLSISSPNIDRFKKKFTGTFCAKLTINWREYDGSLDLPQIKTYGDD